MQKQYNAPTITAEAADAAVAAAVKKAEELGQGFSIAVLDASGNLKTFRRMDNAPLLSIRIAQDKAYTAIGYGIASHEWYELVKDDANLALGVPGSIDRLVIVGGGYPIKVDGVVIGAIGVSGGHYNDDMKVAEAGARALA